MITKLFEIRDSATFIPVMATQWMPSNKCEFENYLIRRAGFRSEHQSVIFVLRLNDMQSHWDPNVWDAGRTMTVAHRHIYNNFDNLVSGDVVDVQYILGQTSVKKISERLYAYRSQT